MLCFLVFSDSTYRNKVAQFLADHFRAHVRIAIDLEEPIGTEELFIRLNGGDPNDPLQLSGLEHWPEGLDNLLGRLNLRREALAERCRRPVLVWTLSTQVNAIITRAADLWAWRAGIFEFALPKGPPPGQVLAYSPFYSLADEEVDKRRKRIERLDGYLAKRSAMLASDIDLLCELGALRLLLRNVAGAEAAYARDELEEALRIRTEVQLPVFERLGDLRSTAITHGQIATIWRFRGQLDEALRWCVDKELPLCEQLGDRHCKAVALGRRADILQDRGQLEKALDIRRDAQLPLCQELGNVRAEGVVQGQIADILDQLGRTREALGLRASIGCPIDEAVFERE